MFTELHDQRVDLRGMLLKPNMVLSGLRRVRTRASADEVAEGTVECFYRHVPAAVPGIVFLSGGQTDEDATAHLNAMNAHGPHPWELSFSYGRALQAPALKAWRGEAENVEAAQQAYYHRAKLNSAARSGSTRRRWRRGGLAGGFTAGAAINSSSRLVADSTSMSIFASASRHRVGRAERDRVREREVDVVEELRPPAGRRDPGALLRVEEVASAVRVGRAGAPTASVDLPDRARE